MKEKKPRKLIAVGLGEVLWDVVTDSDGNVISRTLGGAPANFAYHASCAGMEGVAVSALGMDFDGADAMDALEEAGIGAVMSTAPAPTGVVEARLRADGSVDYVFPTDTAWDHITFNGQMRQLARQATVVCFGSLAQRSHESRKAIMAFLDEARRSDACRMIAFDVNIRPGFSNPSIVYESLRRSDLLKLSDEEIETVLKSCRLPLRKSASDNPAEPADPDNLKLLFNIFPTLKYIVLTLGANGSRVMTRDGVDLFRPADKVERVVDTIGAGDSFGATFIAQLIAGRPIDEAQRLATQRAARVCGSKGAMSV